VKREHKKVYRHCGLDPQSPAKRDIVIASREVRTAWQSRNQWKSFLYTNLTIPFLLPLPLYKSAAKKWVMDWTYFCKKQSK